MTSDARRSRRFEPHGHLIQPPSSDAHATNSSTKSARTANPKLRPASPRRARPAATSLSRQNALMHRAAANAPARANPTRFGSKLSEPLRLKSAYAARAYARTAKQANVTASAI